MMNALDGPPGIPLELSPLTDLVAGIIFLSLFLLPCFSPFQLLLIYLTGIYICLCVMKSDILALSPWFYPTIARFLSCVILS